MRRISAHRIKAEYRRMVHLTIPVMMSLFCLCLQGCEDDPASPPPETGTVTDIDGNVYKTVKIGNQWWMAENLRVTKYRDGTGIKKIGNKSTAADTLQWINDMEGAWCFHEAITNPAIEAKLGYLYNGYAVTNSRNISPAGWHIPDDEEWKELEGHLGIAATEANKQNWRGTNEGEKLKAEGVENWKWFEGIWATDESGFSAPAGGCRMFNTGKFNDPYGLVYVGFWWSSTETSGKDGIWYRHLDYKKAGIFRFYGPKSYGLSIRCVKD